MKIPAIQDFATSMKKLNQLLKKSKATDLQPIKNYTQYLKEYGLK